ncbi:hypothetical protein L208DRAFT_943861 [Tricholoma matsutake]|nr:hypothetical protein L208DRAFT_943861 [Tricholoma matsutake 945]
MRFENVAHYFGSVKRAFQNIPSAVEAFCISKFLLLRSELQASEVSLTDCPHNGRKDVTDKMMLKLVDMLAYHRHSCSCHYHTDIGRPRLCLCSVDVPASPVSSCDIR